MREYVTIPEKGIRDAFVVHLADDLFPGRRVCDGEVFEAPGEGERQLVFCESCRRCAKNRAEAERDAAGRNGSGGY